MKTVDEILALDELPREKVSVPEWGGDFYVATLTSDERDEMEIEWVQHKERLGQEVNNKGIRAWMVCWCVQDEAGKRIFDPIKHVGQLGKKSALVLSRLFNAVSRLNAILPEDIEELVGNSESCQSDDSGTPSPRTLA